MSQDDGGARADGAQAREEAFLELIGRLGPALLGVLAALEWVARRLHPPDIAALRARLQPLAEGLASARAALGGPRPPEGLAGLVADLDRAADEAARACALFLDATPGPDAIPRLLEAMRAHARAQAWTYPLRHVFPAIGRFFLEPALLAAAPDSSALLATLDPAERDPETRVGIFKTRPDAAPAHGERGGFSLYVPESYRMDRSWPLIVALHGGSGHGEDFLWSWLREARSRRALLLAPTSRGDTWSFNGPDVDGPALDAMLAFVREGWKVDADRILLTGLSDGATYSLMHGLKAGSPFTALAPLSGVLHPMNFANGNLERADGRRIYLVHGALDWMFPVALAREAARVLADAGADVVHREIEDLSHAYAREENAHILDWLGCPLVGTD